MQCAWNHSIFVDQNFVNGKIKMFLVLSYYFFFIFPIYFSTFLLCLAPDDYTSLNTTISFTSDDTSVILHIDIKDDDIVEENELFQATLDNPRVFLNSSDAIIEIVDNDGK